MAVSLESAYLGFGQNLDLGIGNDAIDQITGHAGGQVGTTYDDRDATTDLAQVDGGLPGGIAAPYDDHVASTAGSGLEVGGGVVDAVSLEIGQVGYVQAAVGGTGCHDDRSAGNLALVG